MCTHNNCHGSFRVEYKFRPVNDERNDKKFSISHSLTAKCQDSRFKVDYASIIEKFYMLLLPTGRKAVLQILCVDMIANAV